VVETVMIFALGFLAATLIALLFIPAINARADRLARRRAEALFPLSISELTAEKDHLRAEFAVQQRRVERKAEEALGVKHQSLEELGRRAVRIAALESDLAGRDDALSLLQADFAETRAHFATLQDELAGTKAQLAATRETLAAVEAAHRKTLDDLGGTRAELDQSAATLASAKTTLALSEDRLEARETESADFDERHTSLLNELDAKRITISDLGTRLATQIARGDDFERAFRESRSEIGAERERLAGLARELLSAREHALALEARVRELEGERDEKALATTLPDDIRADNEDLRTMVMSVADQVIATLDAAPPAPTDRRKARV
jgi:chromosome segregation ATPase